MLSELGYLQYALDRRTKKLTYEISDWVVECSGAACEDGAVYATNDYGFLCLPRNITERPAAAHYTFEDSDAWLDLWCHTVWNDPRNAFSFLTPAIQYRFAGAVLSLETLGSDGATIPQTTMAVAANDLFSYERYQIVSVPG